MAKVLGLRQQRVQYFYDSDFLCNGQTASSSADFAVNEKILFASVRGQGNLSRTNLVTPGQLSSDQTFLTFAVRHELQFFPVNDRAEATGSELTSVAQMTVWVLANSTFQLKISEKVEFEGPLAMTPAGGGVWGYSADSAAPVLVNGDPAAPSIYVLPLPIAITKRQAIQMIEKKFSFAAGGGAAEPGVTIDIATEINNWQGGKMLRAYIDGYNTRDVL